MAAFIFSVVIQIARVQEMYCGTLSNLFAPAALGSQGLFALNTEPMKNCADLLIYNNSSTPFCDKHPESGNLMVWNLIIFNTGIV
jgi:hypothetical protein